MSSRPYPLPLIYAKLLHRMYSAALVSPHYPYTLASLSAMPSSQELVTIQPRLYSADTAAYRLGPKPRRIGKACDRCRFKKCRCDGLACCTRCKADNTVCEYRWGYSNDRLPVLHKLTQFALAIFDVHQSGLIHPASLSCCYNVNRNSSLDCSGCTIDW